MNEFSTYQGALDVFNSVYYVGKNENCIIGAIVDHSKSASFTASMIGNAFGPAGYVAGKQIMQEHDLKLRKIDEFFYVLLNFTEKGVGIMPLIGIPFKINSEKMEPRYDEFVHINSNEILSITSKNYFGIRKSVKTITITLVNNKKLYFTANMKEKRLPYQEESMDKFVKKYQKK